MKRGILSGLVLVVALAVLGAACNQTANVNTNSSMNRNAMNGNAMMMNANSMPSNMSNMQMNGNGGNMSGMSSEMMKSSPNAAAQPFDLQFIDSMSMHHQKATEMAKIAVQKASRPELKAFAQKIIDEQTKELAQMKDWREKWFAGKPPAINMELSGMMDAMKGMNMNKLETAAGNDFDLAFLDMMSSHHMGAVTMAKEALTRAEHPEIKTLANNISKAQEAEIAQMNTWKTKWAK